MIMTSKSIFFWALFVQASQIFGVASAKGLRRRAIIADNSCAGSDACSFTSSQQAGAEVRFGTQDISAVDGTTSAISFSQSLSSDPVVISNMMTFNNNQGISVTSESADANGFQAVVDGIPVSNTGGTSPTSSFSTTNSFNSGPPGVGTNPTLGGTTAVDETLGYVAITKNVLVDDDGRTVGKAGTVNVDVRSSAGVQTLKIPMDIFGDVVLIITPASFDGTSAPFHYHVHGCSSQNLECSFEVERWAGSSYDSSSSATATASYLMVKMGDHTLDNGVVISAMTVETSTQVGPSFSVSFQNTPVVLAQIQSKQSLGPSMARLDGVSKTKFSVKRQIENISDAGTTETIGIIAVGN